MSDFDTMHAAMAADLGNYEERKVGKNHLPNGLIVSTCITTDCGWETAVVDCAGTHPVQRYKSLVDAEKGHARWVNIATASPVRIIRIRYLNLESACIVELEYGPSLGD